MKNLDIKSIIESKFFPYLIVFVTGIVIRGIPEILIPEYPIGFETITYYAPPIFTFSEKGLIDIFIEFFSSGPLFYVFSWIIYTISGAHPFQLLKILGPILLGFLGISFLIFLRKGMRLPDKLAIISTLIMLCSIAVLRVSWDRFRTILGLIFLFIYLYELKNEKKHKWFMLSILGILTVLSREYIGFFLIVIILGFTLLERKKTTKTIISLMPSIVVFALMFSPILFQLNYLSPNNQFAIGSYSWMLQDNLLIFSFCYLSIIPIVILGWKKNNILTAMMIWLFIASFSVIIFPWFAVPGYQRWIMLFIFPFSIFSANGFKKYGLLNKRNNKKLLAIMLTLLLVGLGYASGAFSYVILPNSWIPTNMVQSSIAWNQVDSVKDVLFWFDNNALPNTTILVEERFYGWIQIYSKRVHDDIEIVWFSINSSPKPSFINNDKYLTYLIGPTNSKYDNFETIYTNNNVSIFQYRDKTSK